jgi:hypothetical protein
MPGFDPAIFAAFGRAFGKLVAEYQNGIGFWLAPVFHIATLVILLLIIKYGNRYRKAFSIYFMINYLWMFIYVGIVMSFLFYREIGIWTLVFWSFTPILLGIIAFQWIKELKSPKIDLDFAGIRKWRLLVIPIIIFGFWYPTYVYGVGFSILPKDLLFSCYGLMPCPTTMLVLGLLSLKYPRGNRSLFKALTLFAVWIGTLQSLPHGYVPDIPLALIGYFSLGLIILNKYIWRYNEKK